MDGWAGGKAGLRIAYSNQKDSLFILEQNGPHLSFNLHKIGVNIYSNLAYAPFLCKKVWSWVDGWMDVWVGGLVFGGY